MDTTSGSTQDTAPSAVRPNSPCTNICRMDPATGWCLGCGRTIAEITAWSRWSAEEREPVWQALPSRHRATKTHQTPVRD
jgi:predicted Fe-S protein YdhL (DUF1289 family)